MTLTMPEPGSRAPVAWLFSVLLHGVLLWLAVQEFDSLTASRYDRHDVVAETFSVMLVPAAAQQAAPEDAAEPEAVQNDLPAAPVETPDIVIVKKKSEEKVPEKPVREEKRKIPRKHPVRKKLPAPSDRPGESAVTAPGINARTQGASQAVSPDAGPKGDATQDLKADRRGEAAAYLAKVRAEVVKNNVYPRRARQMRHEGTVGIEIRLDGQGNIVDVRVTSGSGNDALDEAVVTAARRAKSSGPPPPGTGRVLTLQVAFKLHKR
ncbi:energy transducer TonB [Erwinia sp. S38]|uniref:TonB family protein n=1 Tax=Erwinia sp. S38 TaxID=2769338 RepID=UPI0019097715|nr:energy transducer TonB [Erwinia sp. S38]MBK0004821.1 energy transducer TonB [Erwinia sp. S38]